MQTPTTILTFGEIMGRINPPGHLRFAQAMPGMLELSFAGAEANVAASIAMLGGKARFVTSLPRNVLGDGCERTLRGLGVDTSHIVRTDRGRLGLYFVEKGANQRPSQVVYDRDHSSIALSGPETYDWQSALAGAGWLHTTGITAALSRLSFESTLVAVKAAKAAGLAVSCDLNFRKKLWRWEEGTSSTALAGRCMREILPYVDVVIANEEDASDVLGIEAEGSDIHGGHLAIERYPEVAREIVRQFPNVSLVAITLRESLSASHNNWGAMLYEVATESSHFAPQKDGVYAPYEIRNIVDRVGGGDSFGAGLVFALTTPGLDHADTAVRFAVAASCLAHSIEGDFNFNSRAEVEALMGGNASGRVVR
jgi:2-dehydro-3-deoxygluconokinase